MPDFVTIAKVGQVAEGRGRTFQVAGREIALFRLNDEYFALDDYCPHMGASLGSGDLRDGMVICDRHLWAFNLRDGSCPDVPTLRAETFEVRIQGDEIQVRLPS